MSSSVIPRVVLTRSIPTDLLQHASDAGLIQLETWPDPDNTADRSWLLENVRGAAAVVVMLQDRVDRELVDAAGDSLRVISTMSVGYDHVDLDVLREKKIRLGYSENAGVLFQFWTLLTILASRPLQLQSRRVPAASRVVREGAWKANPWSPLGFCGPSIQGKTVGFIGFGSSSLRPARYLYTTSSAKAFDLSSPAFSRLSEGGFDPSADVHIVNEPDKFKLAEQCDVVFVLASLTPATKHIVDSDFLAKMKPTSILINASRGPLVDTESLAEALRAGKGPWGVGLDVIENEPDVPASHPLLQPDVSDRVLILPHIGSATSEAREAMAELAARNALCALGISLPGEEGNETSAGQPRMLAEVTW